MWVPPYDASQKMKGWAGDLSPPPKFNSSPLEKWWLEDDPFPIGKVTFQGRTVKLRDGTSKNAKILVVALTVYVEHHYIQRTVAKVAWGNSRNLANTW